MPSAAATSRTAAWLLSDLRDRPVDTVVVVFVGLAAAAASTLPFYLLGDLVDRASGGGGFSEIAGVAAGIGATSLIGGLGVGLSAHLIRRLGGHIVADLREEVLDRALRLPAPATEQIGLGDLLSRVGSDVATASRAASHVLPTALNAVFLGVVTLIAMTGLDWRLGMAGGLCVPFYVAALRWYLPRSAPMYAEERLAAAGLAQAFVESIHGHKTIDAYELHCERLALVCNRSSRVRDVSVAVFAMVTRFAARVHCAEFVGLAATLSAGFLLVRTDAVTVGQTTAAALMFFRLFTPIGMLMYGFDDIQSGAASLARLVGVADIRLSPHQLPRDAETEVALPTSADVSINGVSFSYAPGLQVLHDVSLRIPSGAKCAIVGTTGAGKSTLAAIVAGLLEPMSGEVVIGGVPISELDRSDIPKLVALIAQDVHVFSGRLIDDLRLGAPRASTDRIWTVLRQVGADRWVKAFDDGLDTLIGEQGVTLTAPQMQQIAMARLLLVDPLVAVLDEATAEAGSFNADELEEAANAVADGRSTLIVAHRLTQAATADYIAVMADGRIVESGIHAELIALNGRYARLWAAWQTQD